MTNIGVLSDTHLIKPDGTGRIKEIISTHFPEVDLILHAGDLIDVQIFDDILKDRKFVAVTGNMDLAATVDRLESKAVIQVENVRIGLIHGNHALRSFPERLQAEFDDVDAIVFGHTHHPLCEMHGDVLMLNPGSPFQPRGCDRGSVGLMTVDDDKVSGRIIYF